MAVTSAGILVYRRTDLGADFLLGHPGGPLWARKDIGSWTIPKGVIELGENSRAAAAREFQEETGLEAPATGRPLAPIRQASGKTVLCWVAEANLDLAAFRPGDFEMEWPPRSGRRARFPELDRVAYFGAAEALTRILPSQAPLVREVLAILTQGR
jgi:predicted NUDIX family NTP pyrophosphohydrolase